ncbi:hypothetical protein CEXT_447661 [Caerostris extrusa]|uniref:Uncharacterized protein n=1 Tax=Caerostris extrusa TaxID=172846 RepID=A0AAV4VL23_CAEEX|nr:hypothetical protein CEXT_447661 [Caerostris extrusa]
MGAKDLSSVQLIREIEGQKTNNGIHYRLQLLYANERTHLSEAASDRKKVWLACYFCNLEYRERNGFGRRVPKGCKRALYDTLLVGGSTRLAVGLNEWPLPTDHSLSDNVQTLLGLVLSTSVSFF